MRNATTSPEQEQENLQTPVHSPSTHHPFLAPLSLASLLIPAIHRLFSGRPVQEVRDVLYMYSIARQAYDRFISVCGSPEKAQNAVALLVWLDQGTISAIHHVPAMAPDAVAIVAEEANAVLECLRQQEPVLPPIPLISALCMQGGVRIEPGFFAFHQDLVVRGVAHFLDGAGKFVFDDRLHVLLGKSETGLVGNPPELMAPYTSQPVAVPEDCRSMFITFSKGNALHREEIFEYLAYTSQSID